eukprot:TRINITY_DN4381_c0_g1_i1.p1 TRINITY_DN4381_c0_g1~~TRINITY_DN4381_c0_g1_i1.p1  ORF type:complete len:185 (-),score=33.31 TRINITY_DN4381_c0_g1_i1:19-573(-)
MKLVVFSLLLLVSVSFACKCRPPASVYAAWTSGMDILRAEVLSGSMATGGYKVLVSDSFTSCVAANQTLLVTTNVHAVACGVSLEVGKSYILSGMLTPQRTFQINSCSINSPWASLSAAEVEFVDRRFNKCNSKCYNNQQVYCFVDPCSVSKCGTTGAVCYSNYCGGCFADWISDGRAVCQAKK